MAGATHARCSPSHAAKLAPSGGREAAEGDEASRGVEQSDGLAGAAVARLSPVIRRLVCGGARLDGAGHLGPRRIVEADSDEGEARLDLGKLGGLARGNEREQQAVTERVPRASKRCADIKLTSSMEARIGGVGGTQNRRRPSYRIAR